jgi:phosphoserine phosphatase
VSEEVALLVVLDVDSTLSNEEGIDEIAREAGPDVQQAVAQITARAMAGELDFAQSLNKRVKALAGISLESLARVSQRITATHGAAELVHAVHALGGRVCAVSGGFHELVDPLAASLGLDAWRANRLGHDGHVLTGDLDGPIVDAHAKRTTVLEWAEEYRVPIERVIVVGDGANDLLMMDAAGLSVAFCAKPVVREHADVAIDQRDLSLVIGLLDVSA